MASRTVLTVLALALLLNACGGTDDGGGAEAVPATTAATGVQEGLEALVNDEPSDEPGCAVGVAGPDGVASTATHGVADLATGDPIGSGTVFDLASVSKQLTGATVLGLVDDGVLALDDEIGRYLPELPEVMASVTIGRLLHHQSGIPDYTGPLVESGRPLEGPATQGETVELLVGMDELDAPPGETFAYSNSGYVLLAEVVQRVEGRPFAEVLEELVLTPAGMATAFVHDYVEARPVPAAATSYASPDEEPVRWRWSQVGDGAVHATVGDLLAWGRYLLDDGDGRSLAEVMFDGAVDVGDDSRTVYGAGLFRSEVDGRTVYGHDGAWQAFASSFAVAPDDGAVVAVLCNRDDVDPTALAERALDTLLAG